MLIKISHSSSKPIYQQIIDQIKTAIAQGVLIDRDKLLTVRELAKTLAVNHNTVAKAYRQLEQQGVVITRPGLGTLVARQEINYDKVLCKKKICEQFEQVIVDAIHMKVGRDMIEEYFRSSLKKYKI